MRIIAQNVASRNLMVERDISKPLPHLTMTVGKKCLNSILHGRIALLKISELHPRWSTLAAHTTCHLCGHAKESLLHLVCIYLALLSF